MTPVLKYMLEYYVSVEETLGNKKKLLTATCNQLLRPALQLRGLLDSPSQCGGSQCGGVVMQDISDGLEGIFASLFRR